MTCKDKGKPATTDTTPAREASMTREERVLHVMSDMRALRWVRGKSGPVLAAEWGLHPQTLKEIAAEAWRRVRAEIMDPERAGPDIVQTIERVMRDSMAEAAECDGRERVEHRRVALEAAKSFAAVVMQKPKETREVTLLDGRTPEQIEARRREIVAELATRESE